MPLDLLNFSDELPRVECQREERKGVPGVTAGEFSAAVAYALQRSSHGFHITAHGELLHLSGVNVAANASHFD